MTDGKPVKKESGNYRSYALKMERLHTSKATIHYQFTATLPDGSGSDLPLIKRGLQYPLRFFFNANGNPIRKGANGRPLQPHTYFEKQGDQWLRRIIDWKLDLNLAIEPWRRVLTPSEELNFTGMLPEDLADYEGISL